MSDDPMLKLKEDLERQLAEHRKQGFMIQYRLEGVNMALAARDDRPATKTEGAANGTTKGKVKRGALKGIILDTLKEAGGLTVRHLTEKVVEQGHTVKETSIRAFCYKQKAEGVLTSANGVFSLVT